MKKKLLTITTIIAITFAIGACGSNSSKTPTTESQTETEVQYAEITWPEHGIGKDIPKPDKDPLIGEISWEREDGFCLYVSDMSKDDFVTYSNACYDAGFSTDYHKTDETYQADNTDGYHLYLKLEEGNVMFVRVDKPLEEESDTDETESIEAETNDTEDTEEVSDDIRPEVKEALDSYESFMNDYADFMKKYNENPSDSELLSEYADYMSNYADTMDKINNLENDLNDAELKYYTEVQTRVLKVLSDVQ